jgi:hypothetical protein
MIIKNLFGSSYIDNKKFYFIDFENKSFKVQKDQMLKSNLLNLK